uniref:Uncharacterized protein n=1 Tax=Molossus molossus TaxID=27622 RepID=A0A7J8BNM5_MOLMO|nr:hypothetical protein HJG59_010145 [Molossus molossus]
MGHRALWCVQAAGSPEGNPEGTLQPGRWERGCWFPGPGPWVALPEPVLPLRHRQARPGRPTEHSCPCPQLGHCAAVPTPCVRWILPRDESCDPKQGQGREWGRVRGLSLDESAEETRLSGPARTSLSKGWWGGAEGQGPQGGGAEAPALG